MKHVIQMSSVVASMLIAGSAIAQTAQPAAPAAPPAAAAPAVKMDAAGEAKWKALDKDGKGVLEGSAVEPLRAVLTQVDTNRDGKVSREEYAAALAAGVIK